MGLDNIWSKRRKKPTATPHPQFDPPLDVVVGMLGDVRRGWFRGKYYDLFVEEVTGVSLYQEWIPNSVGCRSPCDIEMLEQVRCHAAFFVTAS